MAGHGTTPQFPIPAAAAAELLCEQGLSGGPRRKPAAARCWPERWRRGEAQQAAEAAVPSAPKLPRPLSNLSCTGLAPRPIHRQRQQSPWGGVDQKNKRKKETRCRACCRRGHSNGYCELGYGPGGKKSSANPDKCMALEGVPCHQVLI